MDMKQVYEAKYEILNEMQAAVASLRTKFEELVQPMEGMRIGSAEELSTLSDAIEMLEEEVDAVVMEVEPYVLVNR